MGVPEVRQAALLLYGLSPTKQRSVMARLSGAEAARLEPLLAELQQLGLPKSMGVQWRDLVTPSLQEPHPPTLEQRVADLDAEDVAAALQGCAPMTVALVLCAADWPWQARVLGLLTDAYRLKVLSCMQRASRPLAPAMLKVLCTRLCAEAGRHSEWRLRPTAALDDAPQRNPSHATRVSFTTGLQRITAWMR